MVTWFYHCLNELAHSSFGEPMDCVRCGEGVIEDSKRRWGY